MFISYGIFKLPGCVFFIRQFGSKLVETDLHVRCVVETLVVGSYSRWVYIIISKLYMYTVFMFKIKSTVMIILHP